MIGDDESFLNVKEVREKIVLKKPIYLYSSLKSQSMKKDNNYWGMILKDFYYFTYLLDYSIGYSAFSKNQIIVLPLGFHTQKYLGQPVTNNIEQFY